MLIRASFRSVGEAVANVETTQDGVRVTTDSGEEYEADVLVDASGASMKAEAGWQTHQWALGVEARLSTPVAESMLFMDFDGPDTEAGPPSFLYAMPLGEDRWFLEETVLLSSRRVSMRELWRRLQSRITARGIEMRDAQIVERCVIPLDVPASAGGGLIVRFGAAAGMVHPATGYMVGKVLRRAEPLAAALLGGGAEAAREIVWPADELLTDRLYRVAAEMIDSFGLSETREFFAGFFELPPSVRDGFLDRTLDLAGLRRSMFGVFMRTSPQVRRILLGAGLRKARPLASAALGL
jgi:lycopene beta-cyclase